MKLIKFQLYNNEISNNYKFYCAWRYIFGNEIDKFLLIGKLLYKQIYVVGEKDL